MFLEAAMEKQISVKIPARLVQFLEAVAAREDRPVSGVIRRLVADAAARSSEPRAA